MTCGTVARLLAGSAPWLEQAAGEGRLGMGEGVPVTLGGGGAETGITDASPVERGRSPDADLLWGGDERTLGSLSSVLKGHHNNAALTDTPLSGVT